jgi:nucleotide-binding universal stress UspA family protein
MSIKDILCHLDLSARSDARLQMALQLAKRFGARLSAVVVVPMLDTLASADTGATAVALATQLSELESEVAGAKTKFLKTLDQHGLTGEFHKVRGPVMPAVTRWARAVDLVILGQHDPDYPSELTAPEDVVLSCGRPVLIVPYTGHFEKLGQSVLIAWNGSREATRAAHDALPLMARPAFATVWSADPPTETKNQFGNELSQHLLRHGIDGRAEWVDARDTGVVNALLSRAVDLGADLIVMGAYGHSRLRETILGGATRDMLREMTLPTLMAH